MANHAQEKSYERIWMRRCVDEALPNNEFRGYIFVSTMRYSAKTIANYFLTKSFETGVEVSPMKLIKLVYLAHGWSLGMRGEPLIGDAIQAWKFGPVIGRLYQEFKRFGNAPITTLVDPPPEQIDAETATFLDKIWRNYSSLSAAQLSALTHEKDSPWFKIWKEQGGEETRGAIIPDQMIQDFYRKKFDGTR